MSHSSDNDAREAALDTCRSFICEAPAGSGKTALLVARFLALLAETKGPKQILAITFTRKAAAEMAERIGEALQNALDGRPAAEGAWNERLHRLALKAAEAHGMDRAALLAPGALRVTTFHGFCAEIVKGWPLEAGFPPGTGLLDDLEQRAVIEEAVSKYMRALVSGYAGEEETSAFKRRLAASNNRLQSLGGQLVELLTRRERLPAFTAMMAEGRPAETLKRRTESLLGLYMEPAASYFSQRPAAWRALKEALTGSEAGSVMAGEPPGRGIESLEGWRSAGELFLTKSGAQRRSLGPAQGFPAGFSKHLASALIKEVPDEAARAMHFMRSLPEAGDDPCGTGDLWDVLLLAASAAAWLQKEQAARGTDFLGLELAALKALDTEDLPGESLVFIHEHLRHVLVDEAQDLNDGQAKILGALAEGWSEGDGRTIFVVGDPKQSIYRFRRAEVSLFEDLCERGVERRSEERLRLAPIKLSKNFRSRPQLVEFSNVLFGRVMENPRGEYDESHFESSEAEREAAPAPCEVEAVLFSYRDGRSREEKWPLAAEARAREAAWVAAGAARLLGQQCRGGDKTVAVLLPARTNLEAYVKAFAQAGVPLKVMEGVPMTERPEVRSLHSLLAALLRPHDDIAWVEALRAPWCGASNADLARLAALPEASWSGRILSQAGRGGPAGDFAAAIEPFVNSFGRGDLKRDLMAAWEAIGGPAAFVRRWGRRAAANAIAYFGLLPESGAGEEAIENVERRLEAAYTPPDPGAAFSRVSLMTIHKAKGLEFDYVFAAGLDFAPRKAKEGAGQPFVMARLPGRERLEMAAVATDRRSGRAALGFKLLQELEFRRSLAEQKRLMYVAATRAREGLVLSALRKRTKKEEKGADGPPGIVSWLGECFEECLFDDVPARLLEDPEVPPSKTPVRREEAVLAEVPVFDPQPLPYSIHSPSSLVEIDDETALPAPRGGKEADPFARARGVVMHRLFESLASGRGLPPAEATAAAFAREGVGAQEAKREAARALKEAAEAWAHEEFARLLEGAQLECELGLEMAESPRRVLAGRLDLLVRRAESAIVIDYKTGSVQGGIEEWMERETKAYAPQLAAYRRMAAAKLGIGEEKTGCAVLFTAIPALRWVHRLKHEGGP